jgi:IgA-specific serine endopeptidase
VPKTSGPVAGSSERGKARKAASDAAAQARRERSDAARKARQTKTRQTSASSTNSGYADAEASAGRASAAARRQKSAASTNSGYADAEASSRNKRPTTEHPRHPSRFLTRDSRSENRKAQERHPLTRDSRDEGPQQNPLTRDSRKEQSSTQINRTERQGTAAIENEQSRGTTRRPQHPLAMDSRSESRKAQEQHPLTRDSRTEKSSTQIRRKETTKSGSAGMSQNEIERQQRRGTTRKPNVRASAAERRAGRRSGRGGR